MDEDTKKLANSILDYLDWDESVITALKWSRLYGGSIIVMLIDDGGGLDEPLNYDAIRDIDELRVFERAIVTPDYTTMYNIGAQAEVLRHSRSNFGMPEWYFVFSQFGSFRVHESRCLIFRNGRMPERTSQALYRFWGTPEYLRIRKKMQEADTSASYAVKLLERAVQAVYGMKGLSDLLTTESGENDLLKRLQTLDLARSLLNSIVIDADGESYEFKVAQLGGVMEVIESSYGMLSAVTGIAQTVLLGRSPSGMNATGESDMEMTNAMVERLQTTQVRRPFEKLMDIVMLCAHRRGKIEEVPEYAIKFNPLKSVSEQDQANIDQQRASTQQLRAQTAQTYVDMQAVDPSEVRKGLAKEGVFDIETILDELSDEELLEMPENVKENPQNTLQADDDSDIIHKDSLCRNADEECRAKDPSKCRVHGKPAANEVKSRLTAAKSIEEAQSQAKTLGTDADYSHFDLETANMVNAALDETKQLFPEITVPCVSTMEHCDAVVERRAAELAERDSPNANAKSKKGLALFYSEQRKNEIKKWSENKDALALHMNDFGIYVRDELAHNNALFNERVAAGKASGHFTTGTSKGAIDHEVGHALDRTLGVISSKSEIHSLYLGGGVKDNLSGYGTRSQSEFVAEAWAEYRNSQNPRPIAKQVGDIVVDEYEKRYGGDAI